MSEEKKLNADKVPVIPRKYIFPFILVTSLFALWGFANDITNPLVKAFKDVFVISNKQSGFVQMAFYGGYATMALPAAIFIRKVSYKAGIIVGLGLYALGALLAWPAASMASFNFFLVALYILTFGLAFLETTANPFILSMGPEQTATRRLNFAQAFNPIGSLLGMSVAIFAILNSLQVQGLRDDVQQFCKAPNEAKIVEVSAVETDSAKDVVTVEAAALKDDTTMDPTLFAYLQAKEEGRKAPLTEEEKVKVDEGTLEIDNAENSLADVSWNVTLNETLQDYKSGKLASFDGKTHAEMEKHDLDIVRKPYVGIGMVVFAMMLVFIFSKMPSIGESKGDLDFIGTLKRLFKNKLYLEGVLSQAFYVGAQIMCWTFIIHYASDLLGMSFAEAQSYNVIAMVIFCSSRFICTYLLKYVSPGGLLLSLAIGAIGFTLGTIFIQGMLGLYCLIAISACMSLMFPTIYGIALDGLGEDAKLASAGLIFAIVGGALMPPLQGHIIDLGGIGALEGIRVSFVMPLVCFVVIAFYGFRTSNIHGYEG